jgi:hypothetical protein
MYAARRNKKALKQQPPSAGGVRLGKQAIVLTQENTNANKCLNTEPLVKTIPNLYNRFSYKFE